MRFHYIGYRQEVNREVDAYYRDQYNQDQIFVFADINAKNDFIKKYRPDFLTKNPDFLSFDEFKEKVFVPKKAIISGFEKILLFYDILTEKRKEELNIADIFEFMEFQKGFFSYYREIKRNGIEDIGKIWKYQKRKIRDLDMIKKTFEDKYPDLIPVDWLESKENIDTDHYIKDKKIILVDIDDIPRSYHEMLKKACTDIFIQIEKNDYDEDNLKIKKITLPKPKDVKDPRISIYDVGDIQMQGLDLAIACKKDRIDIYSPKPNEDNYYQIYSNVFAEPRKISYDNTEMSKVFSIIKDICASYDKAHGEIYDISNFLPLMRSKSLKKMYGFSNRDAEDFFNVVDKDYKYISLDILKKITQEKHAPINNLEKWSLLLHEIMNISRADTIEKFYLALKTVIDRYDKIDQYSNTQNLNDHIFQIFNEIYDIYKKFPKIYSKVFDIDVSNKLFRVMTELLCNKMISGDHKKGQLSDIYNMYQTRYDDRSDIGYFIDMINTKVPLTAYHNIIFTQRQCEKLGLPTEEYIADLSKRKVLSNMFKYGKIVIFTYKDENEKIEHASLVEEFKIYYKSSINNDKDDIIVDKEEYINILKNNMFHMSYQKGPDRDIFHLKKDTSCFNNCIKLDFYAYDELHSCNIKYILDKIMKVAGYNQQNEILDISPRYLGNFFHKGMEELFKIYTPGAGKMPTEDEIREIFYDILKKDLGIKMTYTIKDHFFDNIVPNLVQGAKEFVSHLWDEYKNKDIKKYIEDPPSGSPLITIKDGIKVVANVRADLRIEGDKIRDIYDYKTGETYKREQLDIYAIAYYGDEDRARKYVLKAWTASLDPINAPKTARGKKPLNKTDLSNEMNDLIDMDIPYKRSEKPSLCNQCEYNIICGGDIDETE